MKEIDLRLYCLVPYNLSPIQQGIQALHGTVEFALLDNKNGWGYFEPWAKEHKTVVILNAGTTGKYSSMENHRKNLEKLDVEYAIFREPDLNNAMTSIAFIVDMKKDTHITGYLRQMNLA